MAVLCEWWTVVVGSPGSLCEDAEHIFKGYIPLNCSLVNVRLQYCLNGSHLFLSLDKPWRTSGKYLKEHFLFVFILKPHGLVIGEKQSSVRACLIPPNVV